MWPAERNQRIAAVVVHLGVVRTRGQRAVVVRKRLGETTEPAQQVSAIGERLDEIGLRCERTVVARHGILEAPELLEHEAAIAQCRRMAGARLQEALVAFQRLGETPERLQRHAAVEQRLGVARAQRQSAVVTLDRLLEASQAGKREAVVTMVERAVGVVRDRPADQIDGNVIGARPGTQSRRADAARRHDRAAAPACRDRAFRPAPVGRPDDARGRRQKDRQRAHPTASRRCAWRPPRRRGVVRELHVMVLRDQSREAPIAPPGNSLNSSRILCRCADSSYDGLSPVKPQGAPPAVEFHSFDPQAPLIDPPSNATARPSRAEQICENLLISDTRDERPQRRSAGATWDRFSGLRGWGRMQIARHASICVRATRPPRCSGFTINHIGGIMCPPSPAGHAARDDGRTIAIGSIFLTDDQNRFFLPRVQPRNRLLNDVGARGTSMQQRLVKQRGAACGVRRSLPCNPVDPGIEPDARSKIFQRDR